VWAFLAADQDWSSAWALSPLLASIAWLGTLLGLLPFLVLLFPTGRLLSRRWRPVAWGLGLAVGLYLIARLLAPGPIDTRLAGTLQNPLLGVEWAEASCSSSRPSPALPSPS
jgi:two-component system, NarL family, sensor kinase